MGDHRRELESLAALAEPLRRELYLFVEKEARPISRDEAAAGVGIRRALAAFHLDKLVDAGLLEAHYQRVSGRSGPGAGRPAKLYRVARRPIEISLPSRRYELLGRFLLRGFRGGAREADRGALDAARAHGRALGERARAGLRGRPTPDRLRGCLSGTLRSVGYQPQARNGDIRFANCPFHALAREQPGTVCAVNLALVEGIVAGVGVPAAAKRSAPPDPCCVVVELSTAGDSAGRSRGSAPG